MYVSAPGDPSPPSTSNFIPEFPRNSSKRDSALAPCSYRHVHGMRLAGRKSNDQKEGFSEVEDAASTRLDPAFVASR